MTVGKYEETHRADHERPVARPYAQSCRKGCEHAGGSRNEARGPSRRPAEAGSYPNRVAPPIFEVLKQGAARWRHWLISASCCWARCACRMSRRVFLSAQPCFHGLHNPHANALRALIRRCVRFVFMVSPSIFRRRLSFAAQVVLNLVVIAGKIKGQHALLRSEEHTSELQ